MIIPRYQPSMLERFVQIACPAIAGLLDPAVKKSFRSFKLLSGDSQQVETTAGPLTVVGVLEGVGRVTDVFHHSDGSVEATFAHGKFASRLADGTIEHDWLPAMDGHAPLIYGPSKQVVQDFIDSSFSIRLLPAIKDGRRMTPTLERAMLVQYKILTTDAEGRDGIAVAIERA